MSDVVIIQPEKENNQQKTRDISENGLTKLVVLNTGGSDVLFAVAVRIAFALYQTTKTSKITHCLEAHKPFSFSN